MMSDTYCSIVNTCKHDYTVCFLINHLKNHINKQNNQQRCCSVFKTVSHFNKQKTTIQDTVQFLKTIFIEHLLHWSLHKLSSLWELVSSSKSSFLGVLTCSSQNLQYIIWQLSLAVGISLALGLLRKFIHAIHFLHHTKDSATINSNWHQQWQMTSLQL